MAFLHGLWFIADRKDNDMNILIVDDNPTMCRMIKRQIERSLGHGHRITLCSDAEQAIDWYRNGQFDWVCMDIQMEQMDGLCATRRILRIDPDARVIIVTQYNDAEYRQEAMKSGAVGYVLKENLYDLARFICPLQMEI